MKAIEKFDSSKNAEFATFAARCIDNEILIFLRSLKYDKNIDSLDRTINHYNGSDEIYLKDTICYDVDMIEEYIDAETNLIIRELLNDLPERDKYIIMLYFGFYDNKTYTQIEIANMLSVSNAHISRIIAKTIKKLRLQLEQIYGETIQVNQKDNKENKRGQTLKFKTIYEYFSQYTKEEVNQMLSNLTEDEITLITLRYGENLDEPKTSNLWDEKSRARFYRRLVPKMKKMLEDPNCVVFKTKTKNFIK